MATSICRPGADHAPIVGGIDQFEALDRSRAGLETAGYFASPPARLPDCASPQATLLLIAGRHS
jgi:hypothetical protein